MRLLLLFCAVIWCVSSSVHGNDHENDGGSSDKSDEGENEKTEEPHDPVLEDIIKSENTFALKYIKAITGVIKPSTNYAFSPLGAFVLLSMVAYGASENTEKQLSTVLALPNYYDVDTSYGFRDFFNIFLGDLGKLNKTTNNRLDLRNHEWHKDTFVLHVASAIFMADGVNYDWDYTQYVEDFYADAKYLNFNESETARKTINNWCSEKMKGPITNLFKPDDFKGHEYLVLVNAVYFKGPWDARFDPAKTELRSFYPNGAESEIKVPTMYRYGSYSYGEINELHAKFIEIPYEISGTNGMISMFIIVPNKGYALRKLEKNIHKLNLESLLEDGIMRRVKLYLPKFRIETNIPLGKTLNTMGLRDMFSNNADFSKMTENGAFVKVNKAIQKTIIDVNEDGADSGEYYDWMYENSPNIEPPIIFAADRPFLCIIASMGEARINILTARYTGK